MARLKKWAQRAKKTSKRFINPDWANKDLIINFGSGMKKAFWSIFSVKSVVSPESFEQAKARMGLTEEQIKRQMQSCLQLTYIFLLMSFGLMGYSIYNFLSGSILSGMATLGLTLAMLGFSFKFHFWYFQLKIRRLGCSLQDWWEQGILGQKPKHNLPSKTE